jgi:O-antigen ligase
MSKERHPLSGFLLVIVGLTTIAITPNLVFEPIALPRFVILTIAGFSILGALASQFRFLPIKAMKFYSIITLLIAIDLLIVLFFAGTNFDRSLHGSSGRSTGFLTYFSLLITMLLACKVSSQKNLLDFSKLLIMLGFLAGLYGLLQWRALDPINWQNKYGPVVGFFGNPNFESGFLGLTATATLSFLLARKQKLVLRILLLSLLLLEFFIIRMSGSSQGVFIFLAGFLVIVVIHLIARDKKILYIPALFLSGTGALVFLLGLMEIGPLKFALMDSTLYARQLFWKAAWTMTTTHPFVGVGFDGYIDWYRRARPSEATVPANIGIYSDSAHNVFLDISSAGGFPLLILYLCLQFLVIVSIIRLLKRTRSYDAGLAAVISAWLGYQVFSLVSINQLGIAVWGWVLAGLIIGYEVNTRDAEKLETSALVANRKVRKARRSKRNTGFIPFLISGAFVGSLLSIPAYASSANYVRALKLGQLEPLKVSAFSKPIDEQRIVGIARLLTENKLNNDAREIALRATELFPDSSFAWEALASIPELPKGDLERAKSQLQRLDPNNKDLRQK